jgi:beta-galactosidase
MKSPMNAGIRNLFVVFCLVLGSAVSLSAQNGGSLSSESVSLNSGWRFAKDDPAGIGDSLSYANIKDWVLPAKVELTTNATPATNSRPPGKSGGDVAYANNNFDDSQWRLLNLPHDWGIEGPFKQEYPGDTGKLPWWGVGWYRKHLTIPSADDGRKIYLDVDGAMSYATVWMNGQFVGGWPYGYASWRVDLTPFVRYGTDNVIAIRLDNPKESSRWYPGGGIYRNVWLVKTAPVHVAHWGTFVTTPQADEKFATVKIQVKVDNDTEKAAAVTVKQEIFELNADGSEGKSVAALATDGLKIAAGQLSLSESQIILKQPHLWSIENPQRYTVVTTIAQDGKVIDHYETPFGIRAIQFTPDKGFFLNGRHVKLNGVCDHHDLGALGAAINVCALERQLELLKAMGCNAIRTSHNPPAPELLDLCDRMGFLVMDEAFDCWKMGKNTNDYNLLFNDWHEADLRALVRRDRNHPCVILWSIGNEVPDQKTADGPQLAAELRAIVRSEDETRLVSSACDRKESGFNDFHTGVDVFGYNYKPFLYEKFHAANPDQPLIGSETASTISSRGEYFFPVSTNKDEGKQDFQMSSYDLFAPYWATTPDTEFAAQEKNPCVAGEFVWTGFDYLGEPTPYNDDETILSNFSDPATAARAKQELAALGKIRVPSRSSYFGIIDLAGFPKDRYYLYQSHWRPDFPMAHILPHWNWPGREGQITPVHVYTSGDEAELFLNGKSLGKKTKGAFEYRLRWDDVVYQPGELKVVAYKHGKKWATDTVKTTGPAAKLALQPDRGQITADGQDLSFISVNITDAAGLTVPRSKNMIRFSITGPGEIIAVDNGDATSHEPFQATNHSAFNGKALAIVRSKPGLSGLIVLKAEADGLEPAEVKIKSVLPPIVSLSKRAEEVSYFTPGTELLQHAEQMVYKKTPQEDLRLYLLRPPGKSSQPLPAIVYFTGGGWVNGTADAMIPNAAWYREQGIIGIAADYRVKNRHGTTPLECVKDAKSAIRFVRAHARELGIDPNRIIAAGGSAGGHIAAATVLPGNDEPDEDLSVSSRPNALELHNPVLGLGFHQDFFGAHPDVSPIAGVCPGWPPTILSNGTEDKTTSYKFAEQFVEKMKAAGNACELITVSNAEHSCDWPVTNPNFLPTMMRMAEFFREHGIVPSASAKN